MSRPLDRLSKRCAPPPEPRARRGKLLPLRERTLGLILAALFPMPYAAGPAICEERLLVQGLADAEIWNTSGQSGMLSRNEGEAATLGRLRIWAAGDFMEGLQGFALGRVAGGRAAQEDSTGVTLEQAYLRYSLAAPKRLVLQAGRLPVPYGNFSRRYFSSSNPLIGDPALYQISYPLGVQISGALSRFDFTAALLDGPMTRQEYDSAPESSPRPALAAGITPATGFRIGAYFTKGEYLDEIGKTWLLPGDDLGDFHEKVLELDIQFSRAHFELNGELTQARLWLCWASQRVLANLLDVLGVSAPTRMDRDDA